MCHSVYLESGSGFISLSLSLSLSHTHTHTQTADTNLLLLQTCLSKGSSFHFPPSHILSICGIRILLECPIDLSSLSIFSPIPTDSHPYPDVEFSNSCENSPISDSGCPKRRKIEGPLQASDLIRAEPWYKMVKNLLLWDVSSIDVVLISTPMGMLGLPFLTRDPRFSAKVWKLEDYPVLISSDTC